MALLAFPNAVMADDKTPDKSRFSVFDPVPDSLLRSFNADRPTKSNVPYSLDAGRWHYEIDLVNFSRQQLGPVRTDTLFAPNPVLKVGLTNAMDLEVSGAYVNVRTVESDTGVVRRYEGAADLLTRLKINLWGNDGGATAFAVIPYVKAASASPGLGNGATEGGVINALSVSLPANYTLLFNTQVDVLKNAVGGASHLNYVNLVNLSRPILPNVVGYIEFWSSVNDDPIMFRTQYSIDAALAWAFRPNTQFDVGANFGLNRETPAVQVYVGMSQRF